MSKHNPSLPRTMDVAVGDKTITVRKLPLGKAARLAIMLESLPDVIAEMTGDEETAAALSAAMASGQEGRQDIQALGSVIVKVLPKLLMTAQDFVVGLISVGAEVDKQWVEEEVGFDEALDFITAILTVNNVIGIAEKAKNLMGLFGVKVALPQQAQLSGSKTSSKSSKVTELASANS